MTARIDLTPEQVTALADLSRREGKLSLHQVPPTADAPSDVYATPHGSTHGFRITVDGLTTPIGETLPAAP